MRQPWVTRIAGTWLRYTVILSVTSWILRCESRIAANGQRKTCGFVQETADLDCKCFFRDLPCRVPGSVCGLGLNDSDLRCQCSSFYERELNKYCVESK